jgi:hypothetical protein
MPSIEEKPQPRGHGIALAEARQVRCEHSARVGQRKHGRPYLVQRHQDPHHAAKGQSRNLSRAIQTLF